MTQVPARPILFGRSSSHFTRVVRVVADTLEVDYRFRAVRDLMSNNAGDFGDNPALRLPIVQTATESWFGSLNICHELARTSAHKLRIVWPEALTSALTANAQELTLQGMATEVAMVMSDAGGTPADHPYRIKLQRSLDNTLDWLNIHLDDALTALPEEHDLSYLEVALFCFLTHLSFRGLRDITALPRLHDFCTCFAARDAAAAIPYHYDN